ncbi:asparagine synthetase domain-containing protein 1 isoform X3 [Salvia hispanica]|uniref:asparagine synthetase domain-containing protein 1 isoform X3 n=1 Tax=Salvia hispanica TaxID=49212 RepID=UPI0020098DED|nr:asparagine synthetase domain-containing protein 1 isoform X3 [Salvia hispanica]
MCGIALFISGIKIDLSLLLPNYTSPSSQFCDLPLVSEDDIKAALQRRGPDSLGTKIVKLYSDGSEFSGELLFIGSTLQLRGVNPVVQPLTDELGNVLVYNGEIYGGNQFKSDSNDTEILMQSLERCCSCVSHENVGSTACSKGHIESVPQLLSKIRGPWAMIYWQDTSKTLWFGRDAFGRRSLLVHWPTLDDSRLLLSSVSPPSSKKPHDCLRSVPLATAHKVLKALTESVKRRTSLNRIYQVYLGNHTQGGYAPIAVLFSGGLDSMIIAALLHQCIDSEYEIDMLNVSFDGESAPDRISAKAGLKELQKIAPSRRWNLVEIDADLLKLTFETKHVMTLINPSKTYMDLNIGLALWLAAGGDGWLYQETSGNDGIQYQRVKYKSMARILLVGSGADEQCAGYGRHKTKFRNKSWLGLHEEMKLDMQRIWKRNLGRDDRCISDNGKEARFPFLDEDVIRTLLDIPLWEIADLDKPSGVGDKKILREVARLLGLDEVALLPKRAIQFGSRIARESNRKNFGSNRAANQASAGSVAIHRHHQTETVLMPELPETQI